MSAKLKDPQPDHPAGPVPYLPPPTACGGPGCIAGEDIQEMKHALSRIEIALTGDEDLGHRGLVSRVGQLEAAVESLKLDRKIVVAWAAGAGAVILAGWETVKHWIKR